MRMHLNWFAELPGAAAALAIAAHAVEIVPLNAPTQWQRLEFRLAGVPSATNPFDPDQIRVDAVFRAPAGSEVLVPAFWFRDYARRLAGTSEALSAAKTPEWRLRFCPLELGKYSLTVTVTTNGQPAGDPVTTGFDVLASANPPPQRGYVRIAANNRYFETTEGQALPLVGHCVCWPGSRGTYDYDDWFGGMAGSGENYTRIWMAPWAFGLEAEPGTRQNYRLDRAWQLDYVLQLAEARGIYVALCLDYHGMFETAPDYWGGNNYWPRNPYNTANGGPCANQNAFFTSAEAQRIYEQRLRYLIARYGYSPNLLAWEFFNEIDNVYRYLQPADVAAWHATVGDWLKAHDPFHHLVTTSLTGSSDRRDIWKLPQMDFAMYHSYGLAQPAAALPGIVQRFLSDYGKPMMIGEFGTDWRGWRREQDPFLRGWRQGLWAGALTGSVGTSMSWWWENIQSENLYGTYRALHDFLPLNGWGAGAWQPVTFQSNGEPPVNVGDPIPNGAPFNVTLPLDGNWGSKLKGQLAVANADVGGQSAGELNSFVHGTAHPDLKVPFRLDAWLTNNARLVMHLNSVSSGAVMSVLVDGKEVFRRSLPNKDGTWQVNNEYNEDIPVDLAAGRHGIEVRNVGGDWFYLDWVRLENVLPATYANGWRPSPIAVGLRGEHATLLYVVNPGVSFPANATNAVIAPYRNEPVRIEGLPAGRYRAIWSDPKTAAKLGETSGTSDGTVLTLTLPAFTEDLAGRVERIGDFSFQSPRVEPGGQFTATIQGEPGQSCVIEATEDFANWQPLVALTNESGTVPFQESTAGHDRRFYRSRIGVSPGY